MKYRCTMPSNLYVIHFQGFFNILLRVSKEPVRFKNCGRSITMSSFEKINYFDLAILFSLLSIYQKHGPYKKFTELTILKILSNNSRAHFAKCPKRNKTVTKEIIKKSITKLSNIKVYEWNGVDLEGTSFIGLTYENEYYSFIKQPILFKLLELDENVNDIFISMEIFEFYRDSKIKLHMTIDNISYAVFVLTKILGCELDISIEQLSKIVKINQQIEKNEEQYKSNKINYEIFQKRKRSIMYGFKKKYLYSYFNKLKKLQIIRNFQIKDGKINVDI